MDYPTYHRQRLLADLTGDSQLPQMQVAVVGFVKAIIESLHGTKHFRIITLPACLWPDIVQAQSSGFVSGSKELSLGSFQEPSKPQRLVECLALSCVLVQRDHRTRVR